MVNHGPWSFTVDDSEPQRAHDCPLGVKGSWCWAETKGHYQSASRQSHIHLLLECTEGHWQDKPQSLELFYHLIFSPIAGNEQGHVSGYV